MKEAADALRQKIYDYLFFTSARDVFSIASQGYYPQGPTQLGGAATPSERPVLRVSGSGTKQAGGATCGAARAGRICAPRHST